MGSFKKSVFRLDRGEVVNDIVMLLREELSNQRGIKGSIIKRAYKGVRKIKPNAEFVAVNVLFDDLVGVLDAHYTTFETSIEPDFQKYCEFNRKEVSKDLLEIADQRSKDMNNQVFMSTYKLVRGSATASLESAVPKLADLIARKIEERDYALASCKGIALVLFYEKSKFRIPLSLSYNSFGCNTLGVSQDG